MMTQAARNLSKLDAIAQDKSESNEDADEKDNA
jgi:hypothetical protein